MFSKSIEKIELIIQNELTKSNRIKATREPVSSHLCVHMCVDVGV